MVWIQKQISLRARSRGFHLVTSEILEQLPELAKIKTGLAHFFIQHTSASLSLNENADPDVRRDFESYFNHVIPENAEYYTHTLEGPDDMPAHLKTSVLGSQLLLPIASGRLKLGTWQGIYLGEHREQASGRNVVVTLNGNST